MTALKRFNFPQLILFGLVGVASIGCGGSTAPDGMPDLHPVTMVVQQNGQPVEGVSVQFIPQDPSNRRWACGGATDAMGTVAIKTLGKYDGAPEGAYKVTFYKTETEGGGAGSGDDPSGSASNDSYMLVDPKFAAVESTPIEVTVTPGDAELAPVDLGKSVKIKQAKM
ncbi:carboxypeptidase regulatory-like domain-containing protein [Roseiconus lacunae]|uniref:Carboxypeptidase regulatory-like domain-containing protein n=1 Tax=Roseiconus lacunae TaxID=2605694 RepID=A0ABT7PG42_9BACT|nr:carboxypeptidase regulatory-like domain-containing protein [Roseiconus lacunae]MCD0461439.1 carboxypeptidase regulatory-like domain-containing protein [Roseiconus lacunae]MDM4015338.1 carboxypeptidase regulatory-like domain-containing protein [Roseiconus lacunae]WRQ52984.1 carboxypeptidase regulatory-like domain-containing protein [Stieleria sp. HD01]